MIMYRTAMVVVVSVLMTLAVVYVFRRKAIGPGKGSFVLFPAFLVAVHLIGDAIGVLPFAAWGGQGLTYITVGTVMMGLFVFFLPAAGNPDAGPDGTSDDNPGEDNPHGFFAGIWLWFIILVLIASAIGLTIIDVLTSSQG